MFKFRKISPLSILLAAALALLLNGSMLGYALCSTLIRALS